MLKLLIEVPSNYLFQGTEQGEGNARVIGFSLTGETIDPGDGPILEITFGTAASMPADVEVCTTNESFADVSGNPFPVYSDCSIVSVDVESVNAFVSTVSEPVDQGETFEVTISVESPVDLYGFQLEIEMIHLSQ